MMPTPFYELLQADLVHSASMHNIDNMLHSIVVIILKIRYYFKKISCSHHRVPIVFGGHKLQSFFKKIGQKMGQKSRV